MVVFFSMIVFSLRILILDKDSSVWQNILKMDCKTKDGVSRRTTRTVPSTSHPTLSPQGKCHSYFEWRTTLATSRAEWTAAAYTGPTRKENSFCVKICFFVKRLWWRICDVRFWLSVLEDSFLDVLPKYIKMYGPIWEASSGYVLLFSSANSSTEIHSPQKIPKENERKPQGGFEDALFTIRELMFLFRCTRRLLSIQSIGPDETVYTNVTRVRLYQPLISVRFWDNEILISAPSPWAPTPVPIRRMGWGVSLEEERQRAEKLAKTCQQQDLKQRSEAAHFELRFLCFFWNIWCCKEQKSSLAFMDLAGIHYIYIHKWVQV